MTAYIATTLGRFCKYCKRDEMSEMCLCQENALRIT